MKFKHTYPHLKASEEEKDHTYDCIPYYVNQISYGGLVKPTLEFLQIAKKMDVIFEQVNGDDFFRGPQIIEKISTEVDKKLSVDEKATVPLVVRKKYIKQRIFIRIAHKNTIINEKRKLKNRLKEYEKLIKIATYT